MNEVLQLNEFFVEGEEANKSHVLLNITEPSLPEEKEKGYFFAVCEIINGTDAYIIKVQKLIDEIENGYYETVDIEEKSALETVLEKFNQQSFLLTKPDIELNCVVGAVRKGEIIFSFHGQPQIVLFFKNKQGVYKQVDLTAENQAGEATDEDGHPQLFPQIVQGKINPADFFFVGSNKIIDYFSHDRLQKIVSTRTPRQSAQHLERVLSELKNGLSFGGLIIYLQKERVNNRLSRTKAVTRGDSKKSLTDFFKTEKATANIMSPSLLSGFDKLTSRLKKGPDTPAAPTPAKASEPEDYAEAEINSAHAHLRERSEEPARQSRDLVQILNQILNWLWLAVKALARAIVFLVMSVVSFVGSLAKNCLLLFFVATNYQNRRQNILKDWSRNWQSHKKNIKQLPLMTKIMIVASIVIVAGLIVTIVYLKDQQEKEMKEQAFAAGVQEVTVSKDSAESALIYNNRTAALSNIRQAQAALAELDCQQSPATCQQLTDEVDSIVKRLRRIITVEPALLADWVGQANGSSMTGLFTIGKKIIGYSRDTSAVVVYDILSKNSSRLESNLALNGFASAAVPREQDYAVLVHSQNQLAEFSPSNNSWRKIDVSYPESDNDIRGIWVYNRSLYSLDSVNNQIYKHDRIGSGFGRGRNWIQATTNANLRQAAGMAIDGDIFTISSGGQVDKFAGGEKLDFLIRDLDPALTSADSLITYNEAEDLYILDSEGKRLIVLTKEGQLKKQIMANDWQKPTGLVVDEANKTVYILDSNKLYSVPL